MTVIGSKNAEGKENLIELMMQFCEAATEAREKFKGSVDVARCAEDRKGDLR